MFKVARASDGTYNVYSREEGIGGLSNPWSLMTIALADADAVGEAIAEELQHDEEVTR